MPYYWLSMSNARPSEKRRQVRDIVSRGRARLVNDEVYFDVTKSHAYALIEIDNPEHARAIARALEALGGLYLLDTEEAESAQTFFDQNFGGTTTPEAE